MDLASALQNGIPLGDKSLPISNDGYNARALRRNPAACRLLTGAGSGAEEALLTPAVRKTMAARKRSPDILCIQYLCALLAHHNPQRAAELQIPFDKAARAHPYPGEIAESRERMALAQTKEVTP